MNLKVIRPSQHPRSKLKPEDVLEIRALCLAGATMVDVAKQYKVSVSCVHAIKERRTWTFLRSPTQPKLELEPSLGNENEPFGRPSRS